MRILRFTLILFAAALPFVAGCQRDDSIHEDIALHEGREPIRLRVAILKNKDLVWFFRLSGPAEQVKEHSPTFEEFVKSVRFEGDIDATWTEPKTWKKDPPGGMRYAGYRLNAKPKELEVTITRLPLKGFKLVENMHRWQRQINVPLSETVEEAEAALKADVTAEKHPIEWVDMQGLALHSVSKPPEPMAANQKKFFAPVQGKKEGRGLTPFTYVVPETWVKKPPRQFVVEAYEIAKGDQKAELTLSAARGDLVENIKRWRKQVDLPEGTNDEVRRSIEQLPIRGIKNHYVDIANPKGPPGKNRILGVIIPMGEESWFVKMTGPHDWVGQNKDAFETFVKSFKLDAR